MAGRNHDQPANALQRFANSTSECMMLPRMGCACSNKRIRMLESPQDESVVRWGNEGDSFVVLEVRRRSKDNTKGVHVYTLDPVANRHCRTRNSQNTSCRNTSSTATSRVSCASLTSTTSTKCDTTTRRMVNRSTVLVLVDYKWPFDRPLD